MGDAVLRAERHELVREPAGGGPLPTKLVDVAGEVQCQADRDRMRQFPRAVESTLRGLQTPFGKPLNSKRDSKMVQDVHAVVHAGREDVRPGIFRVVEA